MTKKIFGLAVLLLALCASAVALANAAEPPGLTIIVANPPDMLSLSIIPRPGEPPIPLQADKQGWEIKYRYFYHANPSARKLKSPVLLAEWGESSFEVPIPAEYFGYNNQVTLDLNGHAVSWGQSPYRTPLLVAMRVLLTLIAEGLVFFLFGYRSKSSWLVFLLVNLVSQTALNIIFAGASGYWEILYAIVEIGVFTVESLAFRALLSEHGKKRAVFCALVANGVSLVLGGLMLMRLPV